MSSNADDTRFQLASTSLALERDRTDHLVTRAGQGIATAGTLMALFLGLGNSALTNLKSTNPDLPTLREILAIGMVLFAADLLIFLLAHRIAKYRADPDPAAIVNELADMDHREIIRLLTANFVQATLENHKQNDFKAGTIRVGYYLLGISVFTVLVFGIGLVTAFSAQ